MCWLRRVHNQRHRVRLRAGGVCLRGVLRIGCPCALCGACRERQQRFAAYPCLDFRGDPETGGDLGGCLSAASWAPGGLQHVPSPDGANHGPVGNRRPAPCSVPRPAARTMRAPPGARLSGALHSALVGVQPTRLYGPRPSGPGKAAASSRTALHSTARSVVSTGEAGTDDARNAASCKVAVPDCRGQRRDNGLADARWPAGRPWGVSTRPSRTTFETSCIQPPAEAPTGAPRVFHSGRN